ncbi:MAG: hypothetical protein ABFR62_04815 [Bacteroidota bacterium]
MDKVQKILTYVIALIAVISAYLWWSLAGQEDPVASDVDSFYSLTVIMLAATVGITIVASLLQLFTDGKKLKQALIVLVLFGAIVGVSYGLASDEEVVFLGETLTKSPQESKMVGTGMYTTYITGILAILSIVLSPVIKFIK